MIINFLDFRSVFVFLLHSSEHWIAAKLFFCAFVDYKLWFVLCVLSKGASSVPEETEVAVWNEAWNELSVLKSVGGAIPGASLVHML